MLQPLPDPTKRFFDQVVIPVNYVISKIGDKYYAKNGETGVIDFVGTDYDTVKDNVINALPNKTGLIVDKTGETIKYEWYFQGKRRNFDLFPYVNIPDNKAYVILRFDDSYDDHYLQAYPLMKARGMVGVIFLWVGRVGISGYLTLDQLKELVEEGWEIASHTQTHTRFDTLTRAEIESEVRQTKEWVEENLQSPCITFSYPAFITNDKYGNNVKDLVAKYHPYGCTGTELWDGKPSQTIGRYIAVRNDNVANFESLLDDGIAEKKIIICLTHSFGTADFQITEANFEKLLDLIDSKGLKVVTFRDIASRYSYPFARWKDMPDLEKSYSGTKTLSGDGLTTDFLIGEHGLGTTDRTKIVVLVTPASTDAINASPCFAYASDEDADGAYESIRVKFSTAPATGTDNVVIVWKAFDIS